MKVDVMDETKVVLTDAKLVDGLAGLNQLRIIKNLCSLGNIETYIEVYVIKTQS